MTRPTKVLLRAALALALVALLGTGVIGFAHTAPGRPLLALIGPALGMAKAAPGPQGCPFGFDRAASPAERDARRLRFAALHRGEAVARARPALGFTLGQTTRTEVLAWAKSHRLLCTTPRSGDGLECQQVPLAFLPTPGESGALLQGLWLGFGEGERLESVVALRKEPRPEPVSAAFAALARSLAEQAGPPSLQQGDGSAQGLAAGLLAQSSAEYRFRDYYALARVTNLGDGYLLTSEYRALPGT